MSAVLKQVVTSPAPAPLSPGAAPQSTPQAAPRPAAPRSVMLDELRTAAAQGFGALFQQMFRAADDVLARLAEQAPTDSERRRCLDVGASLRMEQSRLLRSITRSIDLSWNPLAPPLSMEPGAAEDTDEQVELTNIASRAKKLHRAELGELHQRLETAMRQQGLAISTQALSARRLCDALRVSLAPLDLDRPSRVLVYKLFDRAVIAQLGKVYAALREVLDRHLVLTQPAPVPNLEDRTETLEVESLRDALLGRVRSAVVQELEAHTQDFKLPAETQALLLSGFAPLLSTRLLRHGIQSRMWNDGIDRLAQILKQLQPSLVNEDREPIREELLAALGEDLRDAGMATERATTFLGSLRAAFARADLKPAA